MSASPRLKTVTFGCKVNQYDGELLREGLLQAGYREAADGQTPDLIVVNSCAVTAESEAKCRKRIRLLAKKFPGAEIVVAGCYAVRCPEVLAGLPGVTEVLAGRDRIDVFLFQRGLKNLPNGISAFEGRHRAWVKIQDGCNQHCSYCIVPHVRPTLFSRPVEDVLAEVERLVRAGYREIVLCGIHLGWYGIDRSNAPIDLAALVRRVIDLDGDFRVRLSSIEAPEITDSLLALMAERPDRLCPHLHIPLQSGSDKILHAMRRRWTVQQFLDRCLEIHNRLDRPALTTDALVGFPGETEADFQATCRAVEQAGFSKVHVFRFSPRPGTPAAELPCRVPQRTHQHWASQLGRLSDDLHQRYLKNLEGKNLQVLIEGAAETAPGLIYGTADRYVTVVLPGNVDLEGRLIWTKAAGVSGNRIQGDKARETACGLA